MRMFAPSMIIAAFVGLALGHAVEAQSSDRRQERAELQQKCEHSNLLTQVFKLEETGLFASATEAWEAAHSLCLQALRYLTELMIQGKDNEIRAIAGVNDTLPLRGEKLSGSISPSVEKSDKPVGSVPQAPPREQRDNTNAPWFAGGSTPSTFKAALAAQRELTGLSDRGWQVPHRVQGICAAMRSVELSCDFNTRVTLSRFLAINGKGLFPANGGDRRCTEQDCFVGHPTQNGRLSDAVQRNAKLFEGGDLTAEAVQQEWQK
jgi:hypothetical protein